MFVYLSSVFGHRTENTREVITMSKRGHGEKSSEKYNSSTSSISFLCLFRDNCEKTPFLKKEVHSFSLSIHDEKEVLIYTILQETYYIARIKIFE